MAEDAPQNSTPPPDRDSKEPGVTGRKAIWLGFAEKERLSSQKVRIRLRWGRIGLVVAGTALIVYLAGAFALLLFFKYKRNYDEASYVNMLAYPFRQEAHRKEMGDYFIEKAKTAIEQQDFRGALHLLRTGLVRSPENTEGRLILSEFYEFGIRRPDLAIDLLRQGIDYNERNAAYIRRLLSLMLNHENDAGVIAVAERLLTPAPESEDLAHLIAFAAARAYHFRGNFDEAEAFLQRYNLESKIDGVLLSAQISWDRGQETLAIDKLENALDRFPEAEPIYIQLSRFFRERGEYDKARQYAVLRAINSPLSPGPRIELIYAHHYSGQEDRKEREVDNVIRQFSNDELAIQLLANFAADTGDVSLARRLYGHALEKEFDISTFALLLIEAHVVAGDYAGAITFAEELFKEKPRWLEEKSAIFSSLRAVAHFGAGQNDLGEIYLKEFLQNSGLRVETLLAVSRRLKDLEHYDEAHRVLASAIRANPDNQAALTELIRLELAIGRTNRLAERLETLLTMRRPPRELLETAYRTLASDRFLFVEGRESILIELDGLLGSPSTES
ncbi:MAG: tetratricopeptide repeat protein [Opitutales bacterium]